MNDTIFPIKLTLRIDWSELDYFGHVNNVSYFKNLQSARINFWDTIGNTKMHLEENIGPMFASSKCVFKRSLHYPGEITIQSRVNYVKNTSFSFCHQIIDDNGQVAAEAKDVMVMLDFKKNEKIQFPGDLKAKIETLEGRKY